MICPAPASKSGSNWLDRLRSNKGIPTGDNLDLNGFLTKSSDSVHSNSDPPHLTPKGVRNWTRSTDVSSADRDLRTSSVLAELFNMGSSLSQHSKFYGKKCPRKQTNPKLFVGSSLSNDKVHEEGSSCARKVENVLEAANSLVNDAMDKKEGAWDCVDVGKEEDGNELVGFSKSEVTVIDTSCTVWKVDKLVFRKNNVWKVRDNKGKYKILRKKKKGSFRLNGSDVEMKKLKLSDSQIGSAFEKNKEEFITASTQGRSTQLERKQVCEDALDDLRLPPRKRFPFSSPPRKSRKENASVVLIKAIPTLKKSKGR